MCPSLKDKTTRQSLVCKRFSLSKYEARQLGISRHLINILCSSRHNHRLSMEALATPLGAFLQPGEGPYAWNNRERD